MTTGINRAIRNVRYLAHVVVFNSEAGGTEVAW
jgi:hypothetical protein